MAGAKLAAAAGPAHGNDAAWAYCGSEVLPAMQSDQDRVVSGKTGDPVDEEGYYICEDGCEQVNYQVGDTFRPCSEHGGPTVWTRIK